MEILNEELNVHNKIITKVYTDGGTVGKNGTLGTVTQVCLGIYIPNVLAEYYIESGISNNEAEFKALIKAMKIIIDKNIEHACFYMDSKIVVARANGAKPKKEKFKNERMDAFQDEVFRLRNYFRFIRFEWIPREVNIVADKLTQIAKEKLL